MKLYIKNMVCPRCIMSVEQMLTQMNIPFHHVGLGEVSISKDLSDEELSGFERNLEQLGFELLGDPSSRLIEKVKTVLIQKIKQGIESPFSIQKFLTGEVYKDYSSVSKLFSEVEGLTIEQFFILQKIEKAKELLVYNEMTLVEIADFLGYSSSQHLSAQFKRVTGMTASQFKQRGLRHKGPIEGVQ